VGPAGRGGLRGPDARWSRRPDPLRPGRDDRRPGGGAARDGAAARVLLFGGGIGGEAPLAEAAAYDRVLALAAAGQVTLDADAVPLADVEKAWPRAGSDRRVVFVP
jgi:hypothetical protein